MNHKKQAILKRRALDEDPEITTVLEFNFSNTTHNVFVTFDITSNNDGELIIKSNSGNNIMTISNTEVYFDRTVNAKTILINNANLEEMVTSSFNTANAAGGEGATLSFNKANAANLLASDAYGFANIANDRAVAAFNAANNASGGSPGGPNLSIQYKSDASFAGSNNLYYNISSNTLVITENVSYINAKAVIPSISSNLGFSIDSSNDCIMILDNSGSNTINSICVGDLFLQVFTRDFRGGFNFFTDFINEISTTATDGSLSETNSGTNAATATQDSDTANTVLGMVRSTTGTTATGRAAVSSASSIFRFGNGETYYETRLRINTISNGTERYQLVVGFLDTLTAANQVDAAAFLYDDGGVSTGSTASNNWQTLTASNSNRTFNTGLVNTPTTTGWVRLGILVNDAGNSVNFYINDSLVATHTQNIPTTGRNLGFGWLLIKSAGTTARVVDFDYLSVTSKFTTKR